MKKENNCRCKNCHADFRVKPSRLKIGRGKFCSRQCADNFGRIEIKCSTCYRVFNKTKYRVSQSKKLHFCSQSCANHYGCKWDRSRYWTTLICRYCQKSFSRINSDIRAGKNKFCSTTCANLSNRGPNCVLWKGTRGLQDSIRYSPRNRQWIKDILARDRYTCQKCYTRGGSLEVHHIKPFSIICHEFIKSTNLDPASNYKKLLELSQIYEDFYNLDNGITVCIKCHIQMDEQKARFHKTSFMEVS